MERQAAGVDEEIHHRGREVVGLSMMLVLMRTPWLSFPLHTDWPSQVYYWFYFIHVSSCSDIVFIGRLG